VLPLVMSAVLAFRDKAAHSRWSIFAKAWDLYRTDFLFTIGITLLSTVLIGSSPCDFGLPHAGRKSTHGRDPALAVRWPLFIPFIVTGQVYAHVPGQERDAQSRLIGSGLMEPSPRKACSIGAASS
jgi:hypothetical protein